MCASDMCGFRVRVLCPRAELNAFAYSHNRRGTAESDRLDRTKARRRVVKKFYTVNATKKQPPPLSSMLPKASPTMS